MSIVTDFKSIRRKLERQEQKVEFEEKNPVPAMYYPFCGIVSYCPLWDGEKFTAPESDPA